MVAGEVEALGQTAGEGRAEHVLAHPSRAGHRRPAVAQLDGQGQDPCLTGTGGSTCSTSSAAASFMRRPMQLGRNRAPCKSWPRPSRRRASRRSSARSRARRRRQPRSRQPASRYLVFPPFPAAPGGGAPTSTRAGGEPRFAARRGRSRGVWPRPGTKRSALAGAARVAGVSASGRSARRALEQGPDQRQVSADAVMISAGWGLVASWRWRDMRRARGRAVAESVRRCGSSEGGDGLLRRAEGAYLSEQGADLRRRS